MTEGQRVLLLRAANRTPRDVFPVVAPYQGFISCFGTPWGFILASKHTIPVGKASGEIDRLLASPAEPGRPRLLGRGGPSALVQSAQVPQPGGRAERSRHHRRQPADRHLAVGCVWAVPSLILASASPRRQVSCSRAWVSRSPSDPARSREPSPPGPPARSPCSGAGPREARVPSPSACRWTPPARIAGPTVVLGADTEVFLTARRSASRPDARADAGPHARGALRGRVH